MNIAYIWQREDTDLDQATGPVLHVRAVIDGLRRRGHHVRVAAFHDGRPAWSDDLVTWQEALPRGTNARRFRWFESVVRGIQTHLRLPFARLFDSARFADAMLPALRDRDVIYERYDLLASGGVMAGHRLGVPVILELNGDVLAEYRDLDIVLSRPQQAVINWVTRRTFQAATHLVAVSEPLRRGTCERWGIEATRISTVLNGVDIDVFAQPQTAPDMPPRRRADDRPAVIYVGSFQPWHSLDLLVDAFSEVVKCVPTRLILVGDGQTRNEIEAQVKRLGLGDCVDFTGRVAHPVVGSLLSRADVAVLAHRSTVTAGAGTPLKLLEYMAAGKAVVAPNLGNITAVVDDHRTALLFEAGSAPALVAALKEALTNASLRRDLGEAARREAVARHAWDSTVVALEQIFHATRQSGGASCSY